VATSARMDNLKTKMIIQPGFKVLVQDKDYTYTY
jgi:hypothetical protein